MMRLIAPRLRTMSRDERGTSVLELALVLPVISMLSLAAIDFAMAFGMKLQVQQYAQAGADFVVASGATPPTPEAVKAEVVAISGLNASEVTVTRFTECNAVKVALFGLCPGLLDVKTNYMQISTVDTYEPMLNIDGIADFMTTSQMTGRTIVRLP